MSDDTQRVWLPVGDDEPIIIAVDGEFGTLTVGSAGKLILSSGAVGKSPVLIWLPGYVRVCRAVPVEATEKEGAA